MRSSTMTRSSARSVQASLPWPTSDRVDLGCAAGQKDVGETAGRCAHVQADRARRIDAEGVQALFELQTAAADPGVLLSLDGQRHVVGDRLAGLVDPRRSAAGPANTLPARIKACALARLSTSPRATSAWSARCLFGLDGGMGGVCSVRSDTVDHSVTEDAEAQGHEIHEDLPRPKPADHPRRRRTTPQKRGHLRPLLTWFVCGFPPLYSAACVPAPEPGV